MVAPIVLAAGAAGGAGVLGAAMGGSNSKTEQNRYDTQVSRKKTVTKSEQTTISPQVSRQIDYSPQIQIDSPDSSIASKKQQSQTPTQETSPSQPISITVPTDQETGDQGSTTDQGGDIKKVLIIGSVVAGGAWVLREVYA
jgi:hypothetical protein